MSFETCLLKIKYKKIIVSRATGGADKRVDGIKLLNPPGGVKGHLCFMRQGAPNVEKKRKKNIHMIQPTKSYCLIGQPSGSGKYLIG